MYSNYKSVKPEYKMIEVLANIFGIFYETNLDSPYGIDRVNEFRFNKALHEEKIKYFTKKLQSLDMQI